MNAPALKSKHDLSPIALLILESDSRALGGEREIAEVRLSVDHATRVHLAQTLGVTPDDLEEVVVAVENQWGEDFWSQLVLAERTQAALDSKVLRAAGWDRIESVAIAKLGKLVENGAIHQPSELLAVAAAANRASRNTGATPGAAQAPGNVLNVNLNGVAGNADGLEAGDLGTINLSLSPRVQKQLTAQKRNNEGVLTGAKMIDVDDLREIAETKNESE